MEAVWAAVGRDAPNVGAARDHRLEELDRIPAGVVLADGVLVPPTVTEKVPGGPLWASRRLGHMLDVVPRRGEGRVDRRPLGVGFPPGHPLAGRPARGRVHA
jgi:hypothetical protein